MSSLVLVADDDPFNLRLLQELCEAAGYRVVTAADGGEVLDMVARERPDLVLLDVGMPVVDGFEVMRILKADPELASIPIVLVTASGDDDARKKGIDLGAEDYVTKPYRVFEIQQRIRNALRLRAAEDAAERERRRNGDPIDPLTRAGTAQQLLISVNYEYTRAERYGHALTCAVVRIDNYREIVAASGQETGDGILIQLSGGLRSCIRAIDHLFRSDDDEFTILLPETDAAGARVVLQRLEQRDADQSLWGANVGHRPVLKIASSTSPDASISGADALLRAAVMQLGGRPISRMPPPTDR